MKPKKNIAERVQSKIEHSSAQNLIAEKKVLMQKIQQLENNSQKEFFVDISRVRPAQQCRQTISPKAIAQKANSLLTYGQRSCLVLIPLSKDSDNDFEIENGEITWRAANYLVEKGYSQWQKLRAIENKQQDLDLHELSLIHHRHSEPLNRLDFAEAFLLEIKKNVPLDPTKSQLRKTGNDLDKARDLKIAAVLRTVGKTIDKMPQNRQFYEQLLQKPESERLQDLRDTSEFDREQALILNACCQWWIESISGFVSSQLPLALASNTIKKAIREKGLPCSHGILLKPLEIEQQKSLISRCLKHNWSKRELQTEIKLLKQENKPPKTILDVQLKSLEKIDSDAVSELSEVEQLELAAKLQQKLDLLNNFLKKND